MPLKKLRIQAKGAGSRGTEQAQQLVELMCETWDAIQSKFNEQTESEKEEMLEMFNSKVDCLGDSLFGDDANSENFAEFVTQLELPEEKLFMECCKEALLFEDP